MTKNWWDFLAAHTHRLGVGARPKLMQAASLMGIWYAVLLHAIWCVGLLIGPAPTLATAVHGPVTLFPNRYGLALVLVAVAGCAIAGVFMRLKPAKIMMLVPQQLMLGVSAGAALRAMMVSHFADGVHRAPWFIVADQSPAVIALLVHSATIIYLAVRLREVAEDVA